MTIRKLSIKLDLGLILSLRLPHPNPNGLTLIPTLILNLIVNLIKKTTRILIGKSTTNHQHLFKKMTHFKTSQYVNHFPKTLIVTDFFSPDNPSFVQWKPERATNRGFSFTVQPDNSSSRKQKTLVSFIISAIQENLVLCCNMHPVHGTMWKTYLPWDSWKPSALCRWRKST